jgi:hypothetical protein
VAHQLETPVVEQMLDIAPCAGEEIVHAKHFRSVFQQTVAEVRTKKSRTSGHQYSLGETATHVLFPNILVQRGSSEARAAIGVRDKSLFERRLTGAGTETDFEKIIRLARS